MIGGSMKLSKMFLFLSFALLINARLFPGDKSLSTDLGIKAEIIQELNDA
jgi:hypothetical protein